MFRQHRPNEGRERERGGYMATTATNAVAAVGGGWQRIFGQRDNRGGGRRQINNRNDRNDRNDRKWRKNSERKGINKISRIISLKS